MAAVVRVVVLSSCAPRNACLSNIVQLISPYGDHFRKGIMSHGAKILHLRGAAGMDAIYRKISWRLLPLLMLCHAVAYLDRVNVHYARLQMGADLDFSRQVYLWGVSAFFIGYCLCAVPCNLLLEKLGARKTLLRLMLCWGATTAACAFVREPAEFYVIRFLLGVFEAGF
jgi:sugar phosphate permease